MVFVFVFFRKARRKEKTDVAGGGGAGLSLSGLAGSVSLPGGPASLFGGVSSLLGAQGATGQYGDPADHKLYLESTVLERKVPEADLRQLIELPPGLDLNEWLASHSNFYLN